MSNAGPLIHLAKVGSLTTLRALHPEILIPQQVENEAVKRGKEKGFPDAIQIEKAIQEGWIQVEATEPSPRLTEAARVAGLQVAEVAVIHLAYRTKARALLDDETARNFARSLDVSVSGSLGIVLESLRKGLRAKAECLAKLDKLSETMHLSPAVYHIVRETIENA